MAGVRAQRSMNLETDLEEFLRKGNQLTYDISLCEAGYVGLGSFDQLILGKIWVSPEEGEGYYEIPAVSLSVGCESYAPEYILLWLPNEKQYGAWDCDHWILTVFPGVSWKDILVNPLFYLNAQWHGQGSKYIPISYSLNSGMPF